MPQKGGAAPGAAAKSRAPRAKRASDGGEAPGGAAQQAQQAQRQAQQGVGAQARVPDDPIDLCSDEEGDGSGEDAQRVALIGSALHQLNAAIRERDNKKRGPLNTAVQAKASRAWAEGATLAHPLGQHTPGQHLGMRA